MTEPTPCPKCGGPMDMGQLEASIFYTSDQARRPSFWSLDPKVYVNRARACFACGFVELFLDPEKLIKYTKAP